MHCANVMATGIHKDEFIFLLRYDKNILVFLEPPFKPPRDDALHTIAPGETVLVHTGINMEIPYGYFGAIYPRSGLATKRGLRCANCVGVVDADYRGEIMVALYNDSAMTQAVELHDRIAQMVIQPYARPQMFEVVNELSETERGSGGFGHTGK